jgi:hypothetical protein
VPIEVLFLFSCCIAKEVEGLSEKHIDVMDRMQKMGETFANYRDAVMAHFKDMDVELKDWNFTVGKVDKEYNVDVTVKLTIKPKK